ncbi:metal ABC transporter substrate-binding protein [Spongisporangium articulatum]|uniref:Metal ABC transporter substrate-binding protein n=1 Tax=Spongisporangium articulatum TaxID=3362603 RepID=A0ABW8ANG7_9ACTN
MFSKGRVASVVGGCLLVAGCGSGGTAAQDGKLDLVTSFYPLQYVTQRIAGDTATVGSLTAPGAEPHDLELTPKAVAQVADADLVVYLGGFQPSVDEAATQNAGDHRLDVAAAARLDRADPEGEQASGLDPHFWLDPTRLSAVATDIEQRLAEAAPAHAAVYETNLKSLTGDLAALDASFRKGLAHCANRDVVTSHEAFGYLAQRYGLTQVGITGLSPEQEPDAATLARVTTFVREHDVRTIYYETLVSPAIARTVAAETGAATDVLDPIEAVTPQSRGTDYLSIMASNLTALQKGQSCS